MLSFVFKLAVFEGSFEALFYFIIMVAMLIGFCLVCGFILLLTIAFFYYYIKFLLRIFEIYGYLVFSIVSKWRVVVGAKQMVPTACLDRV